jgi:hypothetical protein
VDFKLEGFKSLKHILEVLGVGAGKEGDLYGVQFDRGCAAEEAHTGYNLEIPGTGAWKFTGFIRCEGTDKHKVGGDNPDFDFGFVFDFHGFKNSVGGGDAAL